MPYTMLILVTQTADIVRSVGLFHREAAWPYVSSKAPDAEQDEGSTVWRYIDPEASLRRWRPEATVKVIVIVLATGINEAPLSVIRRCGISAHPVI
mgnify:CR=1 FL=1